jgi:hypothetical protein
VDTTGTARGSGLLGVNAVTGHPLAQDLPIP